MLAVGAWRVGDDFGHWQTATFEQKKCVFDKQKLQCKWASETVGRLTAGEVAGAKDVSAGYVGWKAFLQERTRSPTRMNSVPCKWAGLFCWGKARAAGWFICCPKGLSNGSESEWVGMYVLCRRLGSSAAGGVAC